MPIIQSVERALQILNLFNEQTTELKITDISKQMGLSKSTLHSLLKTLQLHGYIDQNPENGIYGHSRFCNTDFDDKLACLNLSGV